MKLVSKAFRVFKGLECYIGLVFQEKGDKGVLENPTAWPARPAP